MTEKFKYRLILNKSREIDIHAITTRDLLTINEEQGGTLLKFNQTNNHIYVQNKNDLSKIFESNHNNIGKIEAVLENFAKIPRAEKESILSDYADVISQSYAKDKANKQTVYNIKGHCN